MKKLIIVLMVVAVSSFLLVGCLSDGVTPPVDDVVDDVVGPTTTAPIITEIAGIDITSSSTQYINATEAAVVIVKGTAPTYSEVKVYVDGVTAGTANVGDTGLFSVVVAEADLGADGDKVIYATAKEAALDVSAHSVEYTFVLDQVKPKATTLAATAVSIDSAIVTLSSGTLPVDKTVARGTGTVVAGTWYINSLGDSSDALNVVVTDPDGATTTFSVSTVLTPLEVIPGWLFTFVSGFAAGDGAKVVVTEEIAARATILFDEEVTYATASTDGNYTWTAWDFSLNVTHTVPAATFANYAGLTSYFTPVTTTLGLARYDTLNCVVNGMTDLAGNTQTAASVLSGTVGAASATSLAP